ncbi:hypothetical protein OIE67_22785 [Nonomuraea fuscirosea]|uniref:hypothetical protein n=1 Tax=Nonomuraea fuscirosea TaxID=1291556 RepID=UPI002DD85C61|nr:hypothetical protein [Nonomuraea fuscirosea]WSA57335.1 hypothetical protein OIE67_22785 [Nonomuraea fuscirosea]
MISLPGLNDFTSLAGPTDSSGQSDLPDDIGLADLTDLAGLGGLRSLPDLAGLDDLGSLTDLAGLSGDGWDGEPVHSHGLPAVRRALTGRRGGVGAEEQRQRCGAQGGSRFPAIWHAFSPVAGG